jgi:hypothetical protein
MYHWNKFLLKRLRISSYGVAALVIIALAVLLRIFLIVKGWPETDSLTFSHNFRGELVIESIKEKSR